MLLNNYPDKTVSQQGLTTLELLAVFALLLVVLTAVAAYSVPAIARATVRSAVYDMQSFVQLTRIEAIKRNRACRLVIDAANGEFRVWDTKGTSNIDDDEQLHVLHLPGTVAFAEPGGGSPVSLEPLGGGLFQTRFESNGSVIAGVGSVSLVGGDRFQRVSVLGAGGVLIEHWTGSSWE